MLSHCSLLMTLLIQSGVVLTESANHAHTIAQASMLEEMVKNKQSSTLHSFVDAKTSPLLRFLDWI